MAALHYSALDTSKSEIRLLTIEPGNDDEEICCSLSVVSLLSNPRFEALSYVWGDPSVTTNITIDNVSHPVTLNLESALRDLRYVSSSRVIWADALCINQKDVIEKNNQIPFMGDIYRNASDVVAYLGHSSPYLEYFDLWSKVYSKKWPFFSSYRWFKMCVRSWISNEGEIEKEKSKIKFSLGLGDFHSHPYFSRMWTFQEFMLPSRKPTFVVGKKTFRIDHLDGKKWERLFSKDFVSASVWGEKSQILRAIELDDPDLVHNLEMGIRKELANPQRRMQVASMPFLLENRRESDIFTLFMITQHRGCFDPRDKIFALYSLIQGRAKGICKPDYTKPLNEILLEVISNLYKMAPKSTLIFMNMWPPQGSRHEDTCCPSWFPDLASPPSSIPIVHEIDTDPEEKQLKVSEDILSLTMEARLIGKILSFTVQFGTDVDQTLQRIAELMYPGRDDLDFFGDSIAEMKRKKYQPERIAYALFSNHPFVQVDQELLSIFNTITRHKGVENFDHMPFTTHERYIVNNIRCAAENLTNKVFFRTDTGLFGVCSDKLKEQDIIVLSPGFQRPFAARPLPDSPESSHQYSVVEWVFIDGLEGKAKDILLIDEIEQIPLCDMCLR